MSTDNRYYDILQVSPRAEEVVINAAYRALQKKHNPDGLPKDEKLLKSLNEAKEFLLNPTNRVQYDRERNEIRGKVIGEYRVLEEIAEGGFGKTYKGEQILTGMPVCIKHCSKVAPEYEKILIDEACSVWDLRHYALPAMRNVIKLPDGSLVLVMSYIQGYTLEKLVEKAKRIPPEHVAWIAERVLNALKYMHFHGVVHGDVKPANIIVQPDTHTAVLVDFGLASVKPTFDSISLGYTPDFASPEEEAGDTILPESDLYSLGITMLFALSGNIENVLRREVPKDTPDSLVRFIRRLIVRDPNSRPRWEIEDLCDTIRHVRMEAFGRLSTGMEPIPGI